MKKIPTLFERDWNGDKSRVVDRVHPGCEWVLAGEGTPTQKLDGTCCMIRGGNLYKRRELRGGEPAPADFEETDRDEKTGKRTGWMPVGDGPEDRWHREAMETSGIVDDGTFELVGPKIQGNPEGFDRHMLLRHGIMTLYDVPRTFDGLRDWFAGKNIEGLVFHHPDGRMAKIKGKDFGIKRKHGIELRPD